MGQDLLQKLITPDLTKRLGNLHAGSKDVMNHPWFAEVTWERLQKKDIDAPYVPPVESNEKTLELTNQADVDVLSSDADPVQPTFTSDPVVAVEPFDDSNTDLLAV